jgi:uncharacterized FlaG/YvyC family protein
VNICRAIDWGLPTAPVCSAMSRESSYPDNVDLDPDSQDGINRRKFGRREEDLRRITREEVADMVAEELDRIVSDSNSSLMLHFDAKLGQMQVSMVSSTKEIVEAAVQAALRAHVEAAYPPGPIHKHRDHHQGLIDSAEQWRKIKTEVLSWGLRGSIGFILWVTGTALLEYFKREVSK